MALFRRRQASRTALVLSGGGSRGAYQIGVWAGLHDAGFRPDIIVGTSVGAINGAFIASGITPDEGHDIWMNLKRSDISQSRYDLWRFWKWRSLLRHDPLRGLLENDLDWDALGASPVEFQVTAVDMCCGEVQVWEKDELTVDHLLASSAIPGALPPITIDGHTYMDGGIANNTPLRPAVRSGADKVVVILTDPVQPHREPPPENVIDVISRVGSIQTHQAFARELVKGHEINDLIAKGTRYGDWKHIDFHVIGPERPFQGRSLDFDPKTSARRMQQGIDDGQTFAREVL